jgi:predicted GH43/DUF377 family glycosyl hydrolase
VTKSCQHEAQPAPAVNIHARFHRLCVSLGLHIPHAPELQLLNPASARLRDGSLRLYPRVVAAGNVSRIGAFSVDENASGSPRFSWQGYVLEPEAPYELRDVGDGNGCEDPRVTFVPAIDRYVMAYVAFGPRGPEVAIAESEDGILWRRLGCMRFQTSAAPFADKDAAFFPEPVSSPKGMASLAFYHRPTRWPSSVASSEGTHVPIGGREDIWIGYVALEAVRNDLEKLCEAVETHELVLPNAAWGLIKVGAGAPPVRVEEGWLSIIHGVDLIERPGQRMFARYSAGVIVHDREHLDRVIYRSPTPLFVPRARAELHGITNHVVFPTALDHSPAAAPRVFDIYYGMGDDDIGWARVAL